jgi:hypothetical protein
MLLVLLCRFPGLDVTSDFVDELTFIRYPVQLLREVKRDVVWDILHICMTSLDYEKLVLVIGAQREVHHEMSALW